MTYLVQQQRRQFYEEIVRYEISPFFIGIFARSLVQNILEMRKVEVTSWLIIYLSAAQYSESIKT